MIRRLFFELRYVLGKAPWDTGVTPPELLHFLESAPPGRALDLGCGTGTNAITMAQRGWEVTGVDVSALAIRTAVRKARAANVHTRFIQADVTRLEGVEGPFDLVLDIGCLHSLEPTGQDRYLTALPGLVAGNGTYMLYSWINPDVQSSPRVTEGWLRSQLDEHFTLVSLEHGTDRNRRSAWFTFEKLD